MSAHVPLTAIPANPITNKSRVLTLIYLANRASHRYPKDCSVFGDINEISSAVGVQLASNELARNS